MNSSLIFSFASTFALLGWIYLAVAGRWTPSIFKWVRVGVPLVLSIGYATALVLALPTMEGGFGSIEQVRLLFQNDWALTAGWIHYLAFDFFVGCWIVSRAKKEGVQHWLVVPTLIATFMVGPIGYLMFLGIRKTKDSLN